MTHTNIKAFMCSIFLAVIQRLFLLGESRHPKESEEKPSQLIPSNHIGADPCYRVIRLFGMHEFAILFIIYP
jgi:hypothetical protein